MKEYITPVCSTEYAKKYNLIENIDNLKYCTLLHDKQAWGYNSEKREWETWGEKFNFNIHLVEKNIGFDYSGLAMRSAVNHLGVAMGRKSVINRKIRSKALITPFINREVKCKEYYYACTIQEQRSEKVNMFIQWLRTTIHNNGV